MKLRIRPPGLLVLLPVVLGSIAGLTAVTGSAQGSAVVPTSSRSAFQPTFDPANFTGAAIDNAYYPLKPGTRFVYTGTEKNEPSRDVVTVTHRTRTILGVRCTVVEDRLFLGRELAESTFDWYAQDKDGNV